MSNINIFKEYLDSQAKNNISYIEVFEACKVLYKNQTPYEERKKQYERNHKLNSFFDEENKGPASYDEHLKQQSQAQYKDYMKEKYKLKLKSLDK